MVREFAKTNLAIWQDPDWRALPWPAQHVYKMFWEHPSLSYCGVADWRPSKMLGWGAGWDRETFDALTGCLRARYFLLVDEGTEEVLVRSWIRFDGVIRQPRLAVSLTKAYAEVGSNILRGVIVDELLKLHEREPEAEGWKKPAVTSLLDLPRVSAKEQSAPDDPFGSGLPTGFGIGFASVSDAFGRNASERFASVSVPPTTATSTSPKQQHLAQVDAQSADADGATDEPDERFGEFWDAYAHKVDRKRAEQKWRVALKKRGVTADLLIEAAKRYIAAQRAAGKHPQFTKHADSWLNGECWNDDVRPLNAVDGPDEDPDAWMRKRPGNTEAGAW